MIYSDSDQDYDARDKMTPQAERGEAFREGGGDQLQAETTSILHNVMYSEDFHISLTELRIYFHYVTTS